jgi:hypothetical protein
MLTPAFELVTYEPGVAAASTFAYEPLLLLRRYAYT